MPDISQIICEMSGIQDVVGKSIGSANPYNLIRAVFVALTSQQTPKDISLVRGKKIKDIVSRR
jgi:small subunit ribosomal protein S5